MDSLHPAAMLCPEIEHIKGLTNVQGPKRAIGLSPVIVEDAISDIGMLLYLAEQNAGADCVGASCRNEKSISGLDGEPRQALFNIPVRKRLTKRFRTDPRLQSQAQVSIWPGSDCIPHLRFTHSTRRSFMLPGIFVIRVNLYRKLFLREDELYKQGDARPRLQPASFPFGGKTVPGFAETAATQWT